MFGSNQGSGFVFGTAPTTTAAGSTGFSFPSASQTSLFGSQPGAVPTSTTGSGFGSFGAGFGATTNQPSAFGATQSTGFGGTFGAAQPQQQQQQPATGFSGFGTAAGGTSSFGAQQPTLNLPLNSTTNAAPAISTIGGFGGFGSTTNQPTAFGAPQSTGNTFGATNFGATQQQQQPATGFSGFEATSGTTPSFGASQPALNLSISAPSNAPTSTASTGFGAFGSGFGATTSQPIAFGATQPSGTAFGAAQSQPQQQQQQPTTGFSGFGASAPTSSSSFLPSQPAPKLSLTTSFLAPTTTASSGFGNFGAGFGATTSQPSAFGATQLTGGSTLGTTTFGVAQPQLQPQLQPQPQPQPQLQPQQQPATGFSGFGTTTTASSSSAAPALTFSLGPATTSATAPAAAKTVSFSGSTTFAPASSAPSTASLSFGIPSATALTDASKKTTQASTLPTTATTGSLTLKPTTGFSISSLGTSSTATSATTSTPVAATATAASSIPQITFGKLEDQINLWMNELTQFEADFHSQGQTINSWDSLLISNGQKLIEMKQSIEKLKSAHRGLDHQLDFIIAQQKELEQLLDQIEQNKFEISTNNVNAEREHTYSMVETVNNDLNAIGTDLKDFIKKLNETKSNQDSNDPIVQISKILNSHMDVLQWIENQIKNVKVNC